jgi:hypothetical protein
MLIPAYTVPSNRMTGPDLKPANRKITGQRGTRPAPAKPNDLRYLAQHIRGRSNAAAEILVDVAFLKSRGMVSESEIVTSTGAVYQDARGSVLYPRAHRFPCNPMFGYNNLPDLASWSSLSLRNELKAPLAITDPLPVAVNYADRLFEAGAAAHVEKAARWILIEQPKGRDVHQNLIRHVLQLDLLPGFLNSYTEAREVVQDRTDDQLPDMLAAGPLSALTAQNLTQLFQGMAVDQDSPAANVEAVAFVLEFSRDLHRSHAPLLEMDQMVARLDALSKDPDIAASHDRLRTSEQVAKRPVAR